MDKNLENNDWEKEAPALAGLLRSNPFSVPEKYFEELPARISTLTYLEKLKSGSTETGFTIPEHYFNELNENINAEIIGEKIRAAVSIDNDYTVPENYFENLQSNILKKTVKTKQQTRIVKLLHSNILKYASAACFLILSATGFYFYKQQNYYNNKSAYNELSTEQMLYDIDEQVIIDHIEANGLQRAKPSATDVALENYILNNYTQSDINGNL